MALRTEHPLHGRARTRNVGLGLVLIAFAALVFALTVVKVRNGDVMEGYDHQPRASMLPADPAPVAPNAAPVAAPGTPAAGMPGVAPAANGAVPEASR